MTNKLQELIDKKIVIFDGAIGTEIYNRHFFVNTSFEGLNLTNADVISEIHQSYADAGADILTTNTYGANRIKLTRFGLGDKTVEVNAAGAKLARECTSDETIVAGSVGPIGELPFDSGYDEAKLVEILSEQVKALIDANVDFILFESISTELDIVRALEVMKQFTDLTYMLSFSVDRNCETVEKAEPINSLLRHIVTAGHQPTALGLNCGNGPEAMLAALEKFLPQVSLPVIVQPNAGLPKRVDGRMIYMTDPEYFTTYAVRFASFGGVAGVGGCCGTGPAHINDMARSVSPLSVSKEVQNFTVADAGVELKESVPTEKKSLLGAKIAKGEWVTSVEIVPPRGVDLSATVEKARICKEAGVDAINIPDGPRASSRISPIVTSMKIQDEAGIEAVLHVCCRDKNLISMQADMMGCSAAGVHNMLFVTGDPPKLGDYPFASAVFDVDAIGVVKVQNMLNHGCDIGGKPIEPYTQALMGVGADPSAVDMQREIQRTREKVEAGAEFIITQPVFDTDALLSFLDAIEEFRIPVIAGIWPLASYRNAEFMRNEVPGVTVPDEVMERMAKATTKEEQREEGIKIARESVEKIRHRIQGIQVSAPFGNVKTAIRVLG